MTTIIKGVKHFDTEILCYHCHQPLEQTVIRFDEKAFCCNGCQTVYSILQANQLCNFYTLSDEAGKTVADIRDEKQYGYLNDPEVVERLVIFAEGDIKHVKFRVPQVHCISCIWLLEKLYKLDPGVARSRLHFLNQELTIQYDSRKTSLSQIAALLSRLGYAPDLRFDDLKTEKKPIRDRSLYYKIGLAFFATGNVMLLAFPEYLGIDTAIDGKYHSFFGYLSLILSTPVLLYSARDFFISAWQGLKERYLNIDIPLAAGILILYLRSAYEVLTHTGAGYFDSFTGLVFLMLVGKWVQSRTWSVLSFERDYKSYFPISVMRRKGQERESVQLGRLEVGDLIEVPNESIIPADGILTAGAAAIDYSFVTGEAEPIAVQLGEKVFAGGRQTRGMIELAITKTVNQSYLTQLWNDDAFKPEKKSEQSALADLAGRWFTAMILITGGLSFGYWWLLHDDIRTAINSATAVLIVACPCTIALSIPFTMGNILRLMGRLGFYVKNTQTLERMAKIETIVFDKTGTIISAGQHRLSWLGAPLTHEYMAAIHAITRQSSHPISRQLAKATSCENYPEVADYEELTGKGIAAWVDNKHFKIGSATWVNNAQGKGTWLSVNGEVLGMWQADSVLRPYLAQTISRLRQISRLYLLSGDSADQADQLRPLFPEPGAMQFHFQPTDKLEFIKALNSAEVREFGGARSISLESSSNHQENHTKLQTPTAQTTIAMVGDGLNDAGALAQADIGIVITEDINNFTPASDAILDARNFHLLPELIGAAKAGVQIVHWSFLVAGVYNVIGLSYAMSGTLNPLIAAILMPVSSITIVLFGVILSKLHMQKLIRISALSDSGHQGQGD
jgi:P-type Cu+ transporter